MSPSRGGSTAGSTTWRRSAATARCTTERGGPGRPIPAKTRSTVTPRQSELLWVAARIKIGVRWPRPPLSRRTLDKIPFPDSLVRHHEASGPCATDRNVGLCDGPGAGQRIDSSIAARRSSDCRMLACHRLDDFCVSRGRKFCWTGFSRPSYLGKLGSADEREGGIPVVVVC